MWSRRHASGIAGVRLERQPQRISVCAVSNDAASARANAGNARLVVSKWTVLHALHSVECSA